VDHWYVLRPSHVCDPPDAVKSTSCPDIASDFSGAQRRDVGGGELVTALSTVTVQDACSPPLTTVTVLNPGVAYVTENGVPVFEVESPPGAYQVNVPNPVAVN